MVILLWVTHWRASIERVALPSVVVGEYPSLLGTLGPDVAGVLFNRFARCGEVAFVFVSVHGLGSLLVFLHRRGKCSLSDIKSADAWQL
jgi:hypothetical protein